MDEDALSPAAADFAASQGLEVQHDPHNHLEDENLQDNVQLSAPTQDYNDQTPSSQGPST